MKYSFAIAIAVGLGSVLALAQACSSSSDGGAPAADAGLDALDELAVSDDDAPANCSGGAGDTACFSPSDVVTFNSTSAAPTANQGVCASDNLVAQFFDACVTNADAGAPVTDAGDAGDASSDGSSPLDPCDAFIAANSDCALCLGGFGAPDGGVVPIAPFPALIQVDRSGDVAPAVAVCVAAISAGTNSCKQNYASLNLCAQSGCNDCASADNAACISAETTNPLSSCVCATPVDSACTAAIAAVSSTTADDECGASTTIASSADLQAVFVKVGRTLCENGNGDP